MATLKESIICWEPKSGMVGVVPYPDKIGLSNDFDMTAGACWGFVRNMTKEQLKLMVFVEAMHMIVRDDCEPLAVHQALLQIDEYRDGCADDMPGIDRSGEE